MSLISMQYQCNWNTYIRHENGSLYLKKKKKKTEISTNRESNSANHDRSIAPHGVGAPGRGRGGEAPEVPGF